MQQVEALREVKRAEADVKRLKEEAARKAAEEVRAAERQAVDLIERAKTEAEEAYAAGIKAGQEAVAKDRQRILSAGKAEAQSLVGKTGTPDFNKAVEIVLSAFEKRVGK